MSTKSLALAVVVATALTGCVSVQRTIDVKLHGDNPYAKPLFYMRYVDPNGSPLDRQISDTVAALRANPRSPALHNQLGTLLSAKGFPKDAEVEYKRAIQLDSAFYPAWYNLGLLRQARGDTWGATRAYRRTLHLKPGHASALFQMGLIAEKHGRTETAIDYYAKAFAINHDLLDVGTNPRILDSGLVTEALIRLYPDAHTKRSLDLNPNPPGYQFVEHEAPSPVPPPATIVTPAPPATESGAQTPAPGIQTAPPAPPPPVPAVPPPPPPSQNGAKSTTPPVQSVPVQSVPVHAVPPPPPPPKQ